MATRIQTLCDVCMAQEIETPGQTVPMWGDRTLDLCPAHIDEYVKPLAVLLDEYGVKHTGKAAARRQNAPRKAPASPAQETPAEQPAAPQDGPATQVCILCGADGLTRGEYDSHLNAMHQTTALALHGDVCPVCGESGKSGQHVNRAHGTSTGARNFSQALMWAAENGDPHGVYAARIKASAAA